MPPETSDPEKYSIDEMLERLKGKPAENSAKGELVTREDGTQAIRVRKRKRRTEQPKKEEAKRLKRLRIIQVSAALILLMLLTLGIGGAFVYTNTPAYRTSISNNVAAALGGSVEFKMFRVTPVSANAEAVDLTWPDSSGIKAVKLRGVTSKISPFSVFGKTLKGEEIVAREGEVFLQTPQPSNPADATAAGNGKSIRFNRISVSKMTVTAGDPNQPALKLDKSEMSLHFEEGRASSSLKIHRGILAIADWPVFKIDRALVQIQPDGVELIGMRVDDSLIPRGSLDLAGPLRPFDPGQTSRLGVKLENFNLADLLGKEVGKLLDARIDTREAANSNFLSFSSNSLASTELAIAFRANLTSRVALTGFPFLKSLARTLGDKWYEQPNLEDAVGIITRKGSVVELRELDFERRTHLAIKGNLIIAADKSLSGSLEIGIPESVVQLSLNLKTESIFTPVQDGFRWITLNIGGTVDRPADNFAEIYAAAKEAAPKGLGDLTDPTDPTDPSSPPRAPAPPTDADPGKAFDALTHPPER